MVVIFIGLLLGFSSATDIKFFDVQLIEAYFIFVLGMIVIFRPGLVLARVKPSVPRDFYKKLAVTFALTAIVSALSFRLEFFVPLGTGPLKQPPFASIVKVGQLALVFLASYVVYNLASSRRSVSRKLSLFYIGSALLSSVWGIVSFLAYFFEVELDGAYDVGTLRIRGFFVEGGPFGVYLVGAILLLAYHRFYRRERSWMTGNFALSILVLAFLGAQSKTGLLIGACVASIAFMRSKRLIVPLVMATLLAPVVYLSDFTGGVRGYYENRVEIERAAYERPDDANLVMGRISASVIVPRIVAEHPLIGVGLGNYGLVRNNPQFRKGLPKVDDWDLPGLGLLGYSAELGIPLALYFLWILATPMRRAWRSNAFLIMLPSYPFLAVLFGVQITFMYPWLFMSIALAELRLNQKEHPDSSARSRQIRPSLNKGPAFR